MKFCPLEPSIMVTEDGHATMNGVTPARLEIKRGGITAVRYWDEDGRNRSLNLSHIVLSTYRPGEYFDGCLIDHRDGDRTNHSVDNLFVTTRRLSPRQERMVRDMLTDGEKPGRIARIMNVPIRRVRTILGRVNP